jgi:hypothetical protein
MTISLYKAVSDQQSAFSKSRNSPKIQPESGWAPSTFFSFPSLAWERHCGLKSFKFVSLADS